MTEEYNQQRPLSQFTNKEWHGTIIALTFLGILLFFVGLIQKDWMLMKWGTGLTVVGIIGGFVLHYFFGIKIIQIRNDLKHPKYR